jgi:hypothetical protein
MALEGRLYVVVRESVGGSFASFGELAKKVHESAPAEFTYNRLEQKHVMQPTSIVPYVSLLEYIGLLRVNGDEQYEGILDQEPNPEGVEELITQKAVEKLQASGFDQKAYEKVVRRMLAQTNVVLPSLAEIYQAMSLKISEIHFFQLCHLGGVRRHFGFTLVTRRVMLPAQTAA